MKNSEKMSESKDNQDIINVEEYTKIGKKPPKGKKYLIRVEDKSYIFDKGSASGAEILEKAGYTPVDCYSLYQKFKGCDFEKISPNEKVDFTKPGIERFIVKPPEVFHYTIDGEPETTDEEYLTPNQILERGGITPVSDYYVVQITQDQQQIEYKDSPNKPIKMECPGLKFISVYRSSTPVA